jgi:hypothetical protein
MVVVQVPLVGQRKDVAEATLVEIKRYDLLSQLRLGLVSHFDLVQKLLLLSDEVNLVDHEFACLAEAGYDKLVAA